MSDNTKKADLGQVAGWIDSALAAADREVLAGFMAKRLGAIDAGVSDAEFAQALSAASRYAPRGPLGASEGSRMRAGSLLEGWNPERWTALEAVRVRLILARAQADSATLPGAIEEAFRYADEGELCALYRSLQFLPGPERFIERAAEGCRTNMKTVFEANGCDTPFPARHFDDVAWRQLCVKSLFVESPLWRVVGLDQRLDEELARMVLDLAEERRSAGRSVYPELWLCLGTEADERKNNSIETELSGTDELSRKGAILALGRMGQTKRLEEIAELGGTVFGPMAGWALMGRHDQTAFAAISPPEGALPETHGHGTGAAAPGQPFDFSDPS